MKTERISIEIMGPDRAGNGGVKVTRRGKVLKWFYHDRKTQKGLRALRGQIIRSIGKVKGVS